jgi:hypothetical protein
MWYENSKAELRISGSSSSSCFGGGNSSCAMRGGARRRRRVLMKKSIADERRDARCVDVDVVVVVGQESESVRDEGGDAS